MRQQRQERWEHPSRRTLRPDLFLGTKKLQKDIPLDLLRFQAHPKTLKVTTKGAEYNRRLSEHRTMKDKVL
jgi:hypothetical protein